MSSMLDVSWRREVIGAYRLVQYATCLRLQARFDWNDIDGRGISVANGSEWRDLATEDCSLFVPAPGAIGAPVL